MQVCRCDVGDWAGCVLCASGSVLYCVEEEEEQKGQNR